MVDIVVPSGLFDPAEVAASLGACLGIARAWNVLGVCTVSPSLLPGAPVERIHFSGLNAASNDVAWIASMWSADVTVDRLRVSIDGHVAVMPGAGGGRKIGVKELRLDPCGPRGVEREYVVRLLGYLDLARTVTLDLSGVAVADPGDWARRPDGLGAGAVYVPPRALFCPGCGDWLGADGPCRCGGGPAGSCLGPRRDRSPEGRGPAPATPARPRNRRPMHGVS